MDLFLKILLVLFGLFFVYVGYRMLFHSKAVIQGVQKYKYHQTAEPRQNEIVVSKVLGGVLILFGLYFSLLGLLVIFN